MKSHKKTGGGDKYLRRKGVGLLFFRVVNARYKERQYVYIKLLESQRQGDKIRHRQLVNLSVINQLPADRIKPLFEELNKSIAVYKEISKLAPDSCRYVKTSYLLALENAFNVSHHAQDSDSGGITLSDRKTKHILQDENIFFDLILEIARRYGLSPGTIGWVENIENCTQDNNQLALFLLDSGGFPLKFQVLEGKTGEGITGLPDFKTNNEGPEFFLAPSCERLYNALGRLGLSEKENGYTFKEVFLLKEMAGLPGTPDLSMEKLLLFGPESSLQDKKVNSALLAVTGLKKHIAYVRDRLAIQTEGKPQPAQDLICTYFISLFFKKIFDDIMNRHNILQQSLPPRF